MDEHSPERHLGAVLAALKRQGAAPSHLSRLSELVSLAKRNTGIRAIALVGSFAKQKGDRISDLDLAVLTDDGHEHAALSNIHHALHTKEVLTAFSGSHGGHGAFWKLIYLDFSSVEFHVFGPNAAFRLKRPYLPVWDPQGVLPDWVVEGSPIRHEDFQPYEYGDEGLAWELLDCIKWLQRGHGELAKNYLLRLGQRLTPLTKTDL